MRRVFVIGDLPPWTTEAIVESAVRQYLETRDDVRGPFRVFVASNRVNVMQIPDPVAAALRAWYAERLKRGSFGG